MVKAKEVLKNLSRPIREHGKDRVVPVSRESSYYPEMILCHLKPRKISPDIGGKETNLFACWPTPAAMHVTVAQPQGMDSEE